MYTNAAVQLGKLLDSAAFKVWSTALAIILVIIWLLNMFMTIKGVISGSLLGMDKGWKVKVCDKPDAEQGRAGMSNGKVKP